MDSEVKLTLKGLSVVGLIVAVLGGLSVYFFHEMSMNALQGSSPKYGAHYPTVPATDITQAPQCLKGYANNWVGCQKLGQ